MITRYSIPLSATVNCGGNPCSTPNCSVCCYIVVSYLPNPQTDPPSFWSNPEYSQTTGGALPCGTTGNTSNWTGSFSTTVGYTYQVTLGVLPGPCSNTYNSNYEDTVTVTPTKPS